MNNIDKTIEFASGLLKKAKRLETRKERRRQKLLAKMVQEPDGKAFTTTLTDVCFRSKNSDRIADQLSFLLRSIGIPHFLGWFAGFGLFVFKYLGKFFPNLFIPLLRHLIRKETNAVILPAEPWIFKKHVLKRTSENVIVNLNHLGEAILGEDEATKRLNVYLETLSKHEVRYVSIKISTLFSQINLLAFEDTLQVLEERLTALFRAAKNHLYPKFINLDMEEYKDLALTVKVFKRVLNRDEFHQFTAGIVLQSYLPDSFTIQQELTNWARNRVNQGRAPIKIRIVKGANLAMERVEASIKGWPQAPYTNKLDVDANFKKMVTFGLIKPHVICAHIGVASHNIFDIAYAYMLASENNVHEYVSFEMLEGMSDATRRALQEYVREIVLYCPTASEDEFQTAVAYLIRRLDENTGKNNFLRASFNLKDKGHEWDKQISLFCKSLEHMNEVTNDPRRSQNRIHDISQIQNVSNPFVNEPDTDWTLFHNREWGLSILDAVKNYPKIEIKKTTDQIELDRLLNTSLKAFQEACATTMSERIALIGAAANMLRLHRKELIEIMVLEGKKIVYEADSEVSEAIDFAEYYRRSALDLSLLENISWTGRGVTLITPPWNFPCAIPAGGIFASLLAGNAVLFKPAPEAVLVGWKLVNLLWDAGIPKELLQFLSLDEDPLGTALIKDKRISTIILTGATSTAKHFLRLRPTVNLMAETGGKNAFIITDMSDRDLAIKDLVQSAFGHSGQKCSAASLAILEAPVYDDAHFLQQLKDAASSLSCGLADCAKTKISPLIHEPNEVLLKGLTELEEGETWLLKPQKNPEIPNLWSPGIKLGVTPQSYSYKNELFGPVLSIMRAENLEDAIALANGVPYGLTSGIHSLDIREIEHWSNNIKAGNCYINRTITGAIVGRQPFGGCKESCFGPGAKAGGPNYVAQMMKPHEHAYPKEQFTLREDVKEFQKMITPHLSLADQEVFEASLNSYSYWFNKYSKKENLQNIIGEDNFFFYKPRDNVFFRIQKGDRILDIARVVASSLICNAPLYVSYSKEEFINDFNFIEESLSSFKQKVSTALAPRIRIINKPSQDLLDLAQDYGAHLATGTPLSYGRFELLHILREVSLSYDYHRYGNLGFREDESRSQR